MCDSHTQRFNKESMTNSIYFNSDIFMLTVYQDFLQERIYAGAVAD